MPQIALRVSDEILATLQSHADRSNLTLTDYLLSRAIPSYLNEILTVDKVLDRLPTKNAGEVFSIKHLFSEDEWSGFTPGSRISTGRLFYQAYDKDDFDLQNLVEFIGKNSANLAIYRKLMNN